MVVEGVHEAAAADGMGGVVMVMGLSGLEALQRGVVVVWLSDLEALPPGLLLVAGLSSLERMEEVVRVEGNTGSRIYLDWPPSYKIVKF